jgi:hypothetical protein
MRVDPLSDVVLPLIGVGVAVLLVYYGIATLSGVIDFITRDLPL